MLERTANNTAARDFFCPACGNPFELKSKKGKFANLVTDGAYRTMIEAIRENRQPNLFLLSYRLPFVVTDLSVLPRRFLVEPMVIRRKPLSDTARRAGWIGCNLSLKLIPRSALIPCMVGGTAIEQHVIQKLWLRTAAFDDLGILARGWAAMTLGVIERIRKARFSIRDVYEFESILATAFPNNRNIRPKLRQQLQVLRDLGFIRFLGQGEYELTNLVRQGVLT